MTATHRLENDATIPPDRRSCFAVFVGLSRPLPTKARGLLERCGITPLEISNVDAACRCLRTLSMDAVVLDTRSRELKRAESIAELLRVISNESGHAPLIVLTSTGLTADVRQIYRDANAVLLMYRQQAYRQLAAVARRLCGLPGGCCEARPPAKF